ncbi:TPA: hypothetical protein DCZ46_00625 [Candidatus Campbellbacteria bacterium]|nr:MAG: hypothetical protein UR58_C0001G0110 [Candidatus Campbellbacteria bacterium GW2011_OD1_34_28]KKP75408.1 MAG: hypothetical protein UR74_C0001G0264 [Candidatus Campbellbacteria bacterium GW2011_GWD2_35_24]KKP76031.1 MAG: hypothetical protein UR75_C0001G0065 [Candidatus Campbellbacteria bacterium GW2011_GWC2_35_28]KKP77220.1 MAG: hypothetical protein UR76_C0001G0065 [Candidatus Campbellbacteria bacterium GW2011_GWC1_35_31]KKP79149.1 MAG: hypothetical protein UR79_C0001G0065 [Candidatus Cam
MSRIILPIILIIISAGTFVIFIDPTYKNIGELKAEKVQYDEARNKSKELRTIRDGLLEKYSSFSDNDLERVKKMIPDNVDNIKLVMDINAIAAKYGAIIRDIKLNAPIDNPDIRAGAQDSKYGFVTLSFSMTSSYEDFVTFITDLKDSLRLVDITDLSFKVSPEEVNSYKFNFTIKTYWLK